MDSKDAGKVKWFGLAILGFIVLVAFIYWHLNIQEKRLKFEKEQHEFDMKIKNRQFPSRLPWE